MSVTEDKNLTAEIEAVNHVIIAKRALVGRSSRRSVLAKQPEQALTARRELAEAVLRRAILVALATVPPLTTEQRAPLAGLLLNGEA